jgi:2,3-bisphosphoglycerate-independent phosphoglycerate mutase
LIATVEGGEGERGHPAPVRPHQSGNVHASLDHAYAVCELAKRRGLTRVAWHAFLDGRDTPPASAAGYLRDVGKRLAKIASASWRRAVGRYYAMDRDKRWDRLEVAWKMLTRGEGTLVDDLADAVERGYSAAKPLTDEFVTPLLRKGPGGGPRAGHQGRRRVLLLQLPRRPARAS